jgi:hypothetical protein
MVKSKKGDHKAKNLTKYFLERMCPCVWLLEFVDTSHTLTPGESRGYLHHIIIYDHISNFLTKFYDLVKSLNLVILFYDHISSFK